MPEDIYQVFPVMKLKKSTLREINAVKDAAGFYIYTNNPNVAVQMAGCDRPRSQSGAISELQYWQNLFKHNNSIFWAISDKISNKIIGTLGFSQLSLYHRRVEISYDLDYNYWGQGIVTEALGAILEFARKEASVVRAQATVYIDNERSIKLLEKTGFQKEGILKKYCHLDEWGMVDYYMYGKVI